MNNTLKQLLSIYWLRPETALWRQCDIIAMKNLDISHLDHLFELRALNTDVCIQLCRIFLKSLSNNDAIMGFPQKRYGRYYSFMPTDLKDVVAKKFKSKLRSNCNAL